MPMACISKILSFAVEEDVFKSIVFIERELHFLWLRVKLLSRIDPRVLLFYTLFLQEEPMSLNYCTDKQPKSQGRGLLALLFLICNFVSLQTHAWGGRGHSSICEATAFLVKEENLRNFLMARPHIMGHLCNIPDIQWRQLPPELTKIGNPTHYFSPDLIGLHTKDVPSDYHQLESLIDAKSKTSDKAKGNNASPFPSRDGVGSSWWRINQFFTRVTILKDSFAKASFPSNKKEEQDDNFLYNKSVYEMFVSMGIMGHFVADLNQPYHNTADYDGWSAGHGGIHSYYEDTCIAEMPGTLVGDIIDAAKKIKDRPFEKPESIVEKMREVSKLALKDIDLLLKLDPIKKPSTIKNIDGVETKTPAERLSAAVGEEKFHKVLMTHLGRSALSLAHLWDLAYIKAGRPDLSKYRSYRYPLTVDFVSTDYGQEKPTSN
jgi:hypothetical protein